MRAMITGATGFLGSHLLAHLLGVGAEVAILLRPRADLARIGRRIEDVTTIVGDLADLATAAGPIRDFAPETVFHLAWGGVDRARHGDRAQSGANIDGSLALLRLAASAGCRTWVGLGSQAEYAPEDRVLDECAPLAPITAYGRAKVEAYRATGLAADRLGVRFAWVRLFSAYGPADRPGALIPQLIETLLRGERPALTGGKQLWDYLYVADAVAAIAAVSGRTSASGAFNLGSGRVATIRGVVERVRDLIDPALPLGFGERPDDPDGPRRLQADIRRITAETGWSPRVDLDEGLARTVAWYRRVVFRAGGARRAGRSGPVIVPRQSVEGDEP